MAEPGPPLRTARDRGRAALILDIKAVARRHLAAEGAAGLSLRAVARDLGLVSSALYRYFPGRDQLLTSLIVDAYQGLGAVIENAEAACPRSALRQRWLVAGRAVRAWAHAHPHEYGLIYGSPVPGYQAPAHTLGPATRVTDVLHGILADARDATSATLAGPVPDWLPLADSGAPLWAGPAFPDLPAELETRGLIAWTALFGSVSFELFGHYAGVVDDGAAFFESIMNALAAFVGLPPTT